MKKRLNILNTLKKNYFWDVDPDRLDPEHSKRLIIERVFNLGEANEIMMIINYYGEEVIIDVLRNLNYIEHKTLNFISKFFKLPLQSFKCYKRRQLIPQYWD